MSTSEKKGPLLGLLGLVPPPYTLSDEESEPEPEPEEQVFLPVENFCLNEALYHSYNLKYEDETNLRNFIYERVSMDMFCVDCEKESVFVSKSNDFDPGLIYGRIGFNYIDDDYIFAREFHCSHNECHIAYFHFQVKNCALSKIGQSPSIADLSEPELRNYRNALTKEQHRELVKAVGLASHGVGIGGFVYLRRIFEGLVEEAEGLVEAASLETASVTEREADAFRKPRMDERIKALKGYLPEFLVENTKLYSILSKGIHELSEDECNSAFPTVRAGIEIILDAKLASLKQARKIQEASKGIERLQQQHSQPKSKI